MQSVRVGNGVNDYTVPNYTPDKKHDTLFVLVSDTERMSHLYGKHLGCAKVKKFEYDDIILSRF